MIRRIAERVAHNTWIRHRLLPLFQHLNPGDITIRHHWTGEPVRLHAFRHKGYWFRGRERERRSILIFRECIHAGDVVFDVGGHIGYIAMYLGSLAGPSGKVFTFEPGPNNLPYVRTNVGHTRNQNVFLVEKAVGAEDGSARFFVEYLTGQNNSLLKDYGVYRENATSAGVAPCVTECEVQVVSLDSFVETNGLRPRFIKIDVEGAEYLVLRGMQRTLTTIRPLMMVECTHLREEVFRMMREAEYVVVDDQRRTIREPEDLASAAPNLFAVPAETGDILSGLRLP